MRTSIPADLKRRVLIESGYRCVHPNLSRDARRTSIILSRIHTEKGHRYENLVALCPNCHRMAETGIIDRKALRIYKSLLRAAHDRFSQFEMDVLFALVQQPTQGPTEWPTYLNLLIKRLVDAQLVALSPHPGGTVAILGLQVSPSPSSNHPGRARVSGKPWLCHEDLFGRGARYRRPQYRTPREGTSEARSFGNQN